ncbi:MAG: hypothetical protein QNJ22_15710 [Desulfosarcinaceae bacterium]|nr:hypothetical protein [Desulfosarcinaceae bacterium]
MTAFPGPLPLDQIQTAWILGAGYFGRQALASLQRDRTWAAGTITIVDRDPHRLAGLPVETVCTDAVTWLRRHLPKPEEDSSDGTHHLIVPALPLHLAAAWLKLAVSRRWRPAVVPAALSAAVPNPHLYPQGGGLTASIANWRCPDACPAPLSHCTHTGKPREPDLHEALARLSLQGVTMIVLPSRQVAPGVGGITRRQLWDALKSARQATGNLMVATICRCHGVIDYWGPEEPAGGPQDPS